jgi:hypothetical protein
MRALPILSPCTKDFSAMEGDEKRRHCAECDKDVHDLSAGTEADAVALLAAARRERAARLCVRYVKDAGGNVRFRVAVAAAAVAAAAAVSACSAADGAATTTTVQPTVTTHPDGGADANERLQVLMGDIEYQDPEPEAK